MEDDEDDEGPAPSSGEFVLVLALDRDPLSYSRRGTVALLESCRNSYVVIAAAAAAAT
jgi:hypothetical protein